VENLNRAINAITEKRSTEELMALFQSITVPISKIQTMPEVIADPLVGKRLLQASDERSGAQLTLAPPPLWSEYLEEVRGKLSFPPRFGEHNQAVYGKILGYSDTELAALKQRKVI
jgi:crotonobetainyl-CoA:carnitine CoA-transferase CaiB-like acyl-CoA transferase